MLVLLAIRQLEAVTERIRFLIIRRIHVNKNLLASLIVSGMTFAGLGAIALSASANSNCNGNPYCPTAPTPNPSPNPSPSPTPSPNPGGCTPGAAGCGGNTTINGQPTQVGVQQSNQNSGAFFNQGGSSTNFSVSNGGDAGRSNILGCEVASDKFGVFGTFSGSVSNADGYTSGSNYGSNSAGFQGGAYAEFYANKRDKEICRSHGLATVLFKNVNQCNEFRKGGLAYIPSAFANLGKEKNNSQAREFLMACNEMLRGAAPVAPVAPPVIIDPAPTTPVLPVVPVEPVAPHVSN
jgi:hypothetical protein